MKKFEQLHPSVMLLYFAVVIVFASVIRTPAFTVISFLCSLFVCVKLKGKATFKMLFIALPLCLFSVIINMFFYNAGTTIIFYLPNANAVTLESIIYSFLSSLVIFSVILWFAVLSEYMTSDRIIFLFGKVLPSTGLLISMTLGYIPKFTRKIKELSQAQKSFGRSISEGSLKNRLKCGGEILNAALVQSVEASAETASSMKSRGYGSKKRTVYSPFVFSFYDAVISFIVIIFTAMLILSLCTETIFFGFFPSINFSNSELSAAISVLWSIFCLFPIISDVKNLI